MSEDYFMAGNSIPVGQRLRIEKDGQRISVFNIDGNYHAIVDACPHKLTAPLFRGTLEGETIQCPNHGFCFDLNTGECNKGPHLKAVVFHVREENGKIFIGPPKNES
ncbi:MAG: hypothetical protein COV66_03220 [Nitrospinae bacterium CG11_big_fil_rev_8_21_14_0_20_45_15]|nr:MAG: hypothetical protein COV66_03220 [Nitrospinae bacterium CG11_big_fil_rev_8_21_14_0_20_45_15]